MIAPLYALLVYAFVLYLPVGVLVLFSFQGGRFPILPFDGPSLKWYGQVLGDDDLVAATLHSVAVALLSSTGRGHARLPRRLGARPVSRCRRRPCSAPS